MNPVEFKECLKYLSEPATEAEVHVEMAHSKEDDFRKQYKDITGDYPQFPVGQKYIPYYVWPPDANKWGVQLRLYYKKAGHCPASLAGITTDARKRGKKARVNSKDFILKLFSMGFRIGLQNLDRVSAYACAPSASRGGIIRPEDLAGLFCNIRMFNDCSEYTPHKPILLLYLIGRVALHGDTEFAFGSVGSDIMGLVKQLPGPTITQDIGKHPFYTLTTDTKPLANERLWLVDGDTGKFAPDIQNLIRDQRYAKKLARSLLVQHFPASLHLDIIYISGLSGLFANASLASVVSRDGQAAFRRQVLDAYNQKCAFCGLNMSVGDKPVAMEAAHIHWHCYGGLPKITNGIAFCNLHHKLFDIGAFTVQPVNNDYTIKISSSICGQGKVFDEFVSMNGKSIIVPTDSRKLPSQHCLKWHGISIFKQ